MYLSMIELNPRCRQVQAELRDLYQMHRTLSKAFGDGEGEYAEARCLFRVDESRQTGLPRVLLQSRVRPDWERLTVPADYAKSPPRVKEFVPTTSEGQLLQFRLRANPTVKRNGRREGLYKEAEQYDWLRRKGEAGGFALLSADARREGEQRSQTSSGNGAVLLAVVFEGVLRVTDADLFARTLESGIGSAKGLGFGLLSVAPVRSTGGA